MMKKVFDCHIVREVVIKRFLAMWTRREVQWWCLVKVVRQMGWGKRSGVMLCLICIHLHT
jgi:hypothetical protein